MAGGTNAWRVSSCRSTTTLAVFLEVGPVGNQKIPEGKLAQLQFQTSYQHSSGQQRLRVRSFTQSCSKHLPWICYDQSGCGLTNRVPLSMQR